MHGMPKREQQRNRDGFGGGRQRAHGIGHTSHFGSRERQHGSLGTHALAHADHVDARDERRWMIAREIVEGRPILSPKPQQVLKARGRDQHDPSTPPFEERVRSDRRAVY